MSTSLPGFCYDFLSLLTFARKYDSFFVKILFIYEDYLLLHNNTLFTLTLLGIATALAFLFFSFVSENTANIALLYIIAQILIARYTNGYLHGLFSSVFSVICINFFFTYPFFRLNFTLSGYPVTFIGMLIITLLTTATTSRLKKQTEILAKQEKQVQIARQESLRANLLRAVSHDLRTPLTSIIGTTSSLLSDGSILSDAEKRELLENYCPRSNRLSTDSNGRNFD